MTCPRCGTKTRSKLVCPACGHRSRRPYWLLALPLTVVLIAFVAVVGNAYFEDMLRSSDSLADKVTLNIGEDTASADEATTVDFANLQRSLYTVSYGTGFLISPRDVLTAASNVAGLTNIIMYHDGKSVSGTVVGRTPLIAVIRIAETEETPFLFTQAIASEKETLLTLTMKERITGTVSFSENGYTRNFDLPRNAIGSPLVSDSGRVVAIHLRGIALPTALFENDVRKLLEADTPSPPPVELAPVAPITPDLTDEPDKKPNAPATDTPSAESEEPAAEPEEPAEEDSVEPETPVEDDTSDEDVTEEEPTEPDVTPDEPTDPEEPPTEPADPPETDEPVEDDPPTTEPDEPADPDNPEDGSGEDATDDPPAEEEATSTPSA